MAGTAVKRRQIGSPGFTLTEILTAIVILGLLSLGAVRLYVSVVGVQRKTAVEFDMRQDGLRVLNEMGSGFSRNSVSYGGVHGASDVRVQSGQRRLQLTAGGTAIVYRWNQGQQTLTRSVGGGPADVILEGVERFEVACAQPGNIVVVRMTMAAAGRPQPRVELAASLRPRLTDPVCS